MGGQAMLKAYDYAADSLVLRGDFVRTVAVPHVCDRDSNGGSLPVALSERVHGWWEVSTIKVSGIDRLPQSEGLLYLSQATLVNNRPESLIPAGHSSALGMWAGGTRTRETSLPRYRHATRSLPSTGRTYSIPSDGGTLALAHLPKNNSRGA